MTEAQILELGNKVIRYCKEFNVPIEYLFEILEDQKVTPMIRGKAMEYNAYLMLRENLSGTAWSVQKLNLNAQTGIYDEDISITHRRSGIILTVECKSAVRGSISLGTRSRVLNSSHFKVKCHRSRSNIQLAGTSNDRYSVDSFDVLLSNPTNSIYQGNTLSEHLEVIHNEGIRAMLFDFYSVENDEDLIEACENDWRFALPRDIAEDGFIPRTPYVGLTSDSNWHPISDLETILLTVVEEKRRSSSHDRRS